MTKHPPQPNGSSAAYAIGYGKPPVHSRFELGHPGCGGRPKARRNSRTVVKETLDERITIREGKRTRSVTKFHAMILRMMNDAVSGNAKAQSNLISLVRSLGLIGDAQEGSNTEPFTTDDLAIIVDFLGRHGNPVEPVQPPESTEGPQTGEAEPATKKTKETKP